MRDALIVGGVVVGLWWLCRRKPKQPNEVHVGSSMTASGQDSTVYGPGGFSDGAIRRRLPDGAAAKAAAKAFAAKPVTARLSLFRALMAQNAQTPPAPSPTNRPDPSLVFSVRGTSAVTQIT
jgi:hypothetical protein